MGTDAELRGFSVLQSVGLTRDMGTKGSPEAMSSCFMSSVTSVSSNCCASPTLICSAPTIKCESVMRATEVYNPPLKRKVSLEYVIEHALATECTPNLRT